MLNQFKLSTSSDNYRLTRIKIVIYRNEFKKELK